LEVADLRAKVASLEEADRRTREWLSERKAEAGVGDDVSFDVVWAEALAALKREQASKE
jgi:hypothetical protein